MGIKTLHICAYYNPNQGDEVSLASFDISTRHSCNRTASHIWIAGDMNTSGFNWLNNCLKPSCNYPEPTPKFVDSLDDNNLIQLITKPTRGPNTLTSSSQTMRLLFVRLRLYLDWEIMTLYMLKVTLNQTFISRNAGKSPFIKMLIGKVSYSTWPTLPNHFSPWTILT